MRGAEPKNLRVGIGEKTSAWWQGPSFHPFTHKLHTGPRAPKRDDVDPYVASPCSRLYDSKICTAAIEHHSGHWHLFPGCRARLQEFVGVLQPPGMFFGCLHCRERALLR